VVLEDETVARLVISGVLRGAGYEVIEAATAAEASTIAQRDDFQIDLLIADVRLPDKSGVDAALKLTALYPKLPVLFISGLPMEAWRVRDLVALQQFPEESWEFLQKPFRASVLEDLVRTLLERPAGAVRARSEGASLRVEQSLLAASGGDGTAGRTPTWLLIEEKSTGGHLIPGVAFCEEKVRLTEDFLDAIHTVTELHGQQTHALIEGDPEYARFDLLIHLAVERKENAKYALMRHVDAHGCEQG
jgi:CheY-like chemotaxis protein